MFMCASVFTSLYSVHHKIYTYALQYCSFVNLQLVVLSICWLFTLVLECLYVDECGGAYLLKNVNSNGVYKSLKNHLLLM